MKYINCNNKKAKTNYINIGREYFTKLCDTLLCFYIIIINLNKALGLLKFSAN